jgi:hypothetical protein
MLVHTYSDSASGVFSTHVPSVQATIIINIKFNLPTSLNNFKKNSKNSPSDEALQWFR